MPQAPAIHHPSSVGPYPDDRREWSKWIVALRSTRLNGDAYRPHGFFAEQERSDLGEILWVWTLLLTNRECPWHCLMCDLWKTALSSAVPVGAIPRQIDYAFAGLSSPQPGNVSPLGAPQLIKLYNGGSFFDPRAIPIADYDSIAQRVRTFKRVIVECHPAFVTDSCVRFRELLGRAASTSRERDVPAPQLEVALGLETVHPEVLDKLNKGMTLDQFSRAAQFLRRNDIAVRAFVLVKPPFLDEAEALYWAERSIDFAFDAGATVVSLIPTRSGNGALEELEQRGQFAQPKLATLEAALSYGIHLSRGRVFADLWDLERFSTCRHCLADRIERLRRMNFEQAVLEGSPCSVCGTAEAKPTRTTR